MKKKLFVTVGAILLCAMLVGCGSSAAEPEVRSSAADNEERLYVTLLRLVADYQSCAWDGEDFPVQDGQYVVRIRNGFVEVSEPAKLAKTWVNTLIFADLPLEQTLGRNDDCYFQTGMFSTGDDDAQEYYYLSPSGVHCYDRGKESASWLIDGCMKGEAYLLQFGGYKPCVLTGGQLLYCAPSGEIEVLIEGIVDDHVVTNYASNFLAIRDGELSEYSCSRSSGVIGVYPIAQEVVSAVVIHDFATIFSRADGNTYLVQLRDYETCSELIQGDPEIAYRYRLGQEPPKFYLEEYEALRNEIFVTPDGSEKRLSNAEIIEQLLEKYCGSI